MVVNGDCLSSTMLYACERFFRPATYDGGPLECREFSETISGVEVTTAFCQGDTCAIDVDASALPFELRLDGLDAYDSTLDDYPSCSSSLDWEGPEIILRLTNLTSGQVLTIDASEDVGNERDSFISVSASCDAWSCFADNDVQDRLTWTSTVSGTAFVSIDRLRRTPDSVDGSFAVVVRAE